MQNRLIKVAVSLLPCVASLPCFGDDSVGERYRGFWRISAIRTHKPDGSSTITRAGEGNGVYWVGAKRFCYVQDTEDIPVAWDENGLEVSASTVRDNVCYLLFRSTRADARFRGKMLPPADGHAEMKFYVYHGSQKQTYTYYLDELQDEKLIKKMRQSASNSVAKSIQ